MDNKRRKCRICTGYAVFTHSGTILEKYTAEYFLCPDCEHWFIGDVNWLAEAYSEAISRLDTGLVKRNFQISQELALYLRAISFKRSSRALDFAGGTGLLTRQMRDLGYNFFWNDKYCLNVHAKGFEGDAASEFELVTLIEVLEHLENPITFLEELKRQTSTKIIIFTQVLHLNTQTSQDWWYFMPETGQHISFYTNKTLEILANRLDMKMLRFGQLFIFATEIKYKKWKLFLANLIRLYLNQTRDICFRGDALTASDSSYLQSNA